MFTWKFFKFKVFLGVEVLEIFSEESSSKSSLKILTQETSLYLSFEAWKGFDAFLLPGNTKMF